MRCPKGCIRSPSRARPSRAKPRRASARRPSRAKPRRSPRGPPPRRGPRRSPRGHQSRRQPPPKPRRRSPPGGRRRAPARDEPPTVTPDNLAFWRRWSGNAPGATAANLGRQFRRASLRLHPDRNPGVDPAGMARLSDLRDRLVGLL